MRKFLSGLCFGISLSFMVSPVGAQSLPQAQQKQVQDAIQQQEKQQKEQQALPKQKAQDRANVKSKKKPSKPSSLQDLADETGPCYTIKKTTIEGYKPFGQPPENYQALNGQCVRLKEIVALLTLLNKSYQDKGLITTRVYTPEQDLKSGVLKIVVIAGRIGKYEFSDGRAADRRIWAAFPQDKGEVLNLRSLEQGLENFNSLKSQEGKFQLFPGEKVGDSIVRILEKKTKPWHLVASVDNSGFKTTGRNKYKLNAGLDNLFNLNDNITVSASTTTFHLDKEDYRFANVNTPGLFPDDYEASRFSDSYSVNYTLPIKNWLFYAGGGYSEYRFKIDGINQDYPFQGRSKYASVGVERLLYRDQKSKFYASGGLKRSRSQNFIAGFEIESQKRDLSIADYNIRGLHYIKDATLQWSVGGKTGLEILGAKNHQHRDSVADPFFTALTGTASLKFPFWEKKFNYSGFLSWQWSGDEIPGAEQFAFGGRGDVRGFHQDNLYGNSGFYIRNDISHVLYSKKDVKLTVFTGLDAGWIEDSFFTDFSQRYLVGAAAGINVEFLDKFYLDLTYAKKLEAPSEFEEDEDHFYLNFTSSF